MKAVIARRLVSAAIVVGLLPAIVQAQPAGGGNTVMPSPAPMPTMGGTPLPYPAYGTPAPDVANLNARPGVPSTLSLSAAVKVAVALSPIFAEENAQWAIIHARYTSEKQALFPAVSAGGTLGNTYVNGGSNLATGPLPSISPTIVPTGVPSGAPAAVPSIIPSTGQRTGTTGTTYEQSLSLSISQLIYDGGRTIAAIHSAKSADYAGRATLLRNLQTLTLNVSNAYYAVLQADATVVADAQLVKEFEVNQSAVGAQIRNGAAARSDIAAAEFQTAQARSNLVTAQGQAIGAQSTFATTLGLNADVQTKPRAVSGPPTVPRVSYTSSVARALLLRPDYLAAQYTVESDKEGLRYAKLARFPVLAGGASISTGRTSIPGAATFSTTKTLGLDLTIPIYDQGLTNYNIAVAAATLDAAIAALQQTDLQVQSDVRSSLANLISAGSALTQAQAELRAARVSLDATRAQYRVGAATVINVTTAEANLSTAQSDEIRALYGLQNALQNYLYASGTSDLQI